MKAKYPILEFEIVRRGIKRKVISEALHISERSLYNKLYGKVEITWPEACVIQSRFFPDKTKEELFDPTNKTA